MTTTSEPQAPNRATSADVVELHVDGGVATVVLNRPDAMNAVDLALKNAAARGPRAGGRRPAGALRRPDRARPGVLRGPGPQGAHRVADARRRGAGTTVVDHYNRIAMLLATMNKPVVAALNGVTAGAGASMAFACDFRILVEGAGINLAFAAHRPLLRHRVVLVAPASGRHRQGQGAAHAPAHHPQRRVPRPRARDQVVPADQFEQTVSELARSLAAGPTLAYGSIRRAVAASAGQDLESPSRTRPS